MVIIENFHSDLKCLSYLPRSCFGFLVADDVGGWLVIGTMRKFRSANGINRSSLAWDSFGWQGYGIRKQIHFEFFYFNVSKTKTFKPWKKSIEATAPATLFKTSWSPVDWLIFFQVQCWHHLHWRSSDATTSCLASMSSCLYDSVQIVHSSCMPWWGPYIFYPDFKYAWERRVKGSKGAKGQSMGNSNWNTTGTEYHRWVQKWGFL